MPRHQIHYTVSEDSVEYLKGFDNKSRIIDEALNLHKHQDKEFKRVEPKLLQNIEVDI